ncbi:galactomannan galactosyltransferase 1 [Artemisia annua]|uniref:Galactomannan galactosyltransferase 1 n=1 Tax=Artemisia annua TaxID=35608 RepID=A0A2U1PTB4_ARTAN|nr:galactomannan galactosyltransferase 1 [Artemisia annua]
MVVFTQIGSRKQFICTFERPSAFLAGAVLALLSLWACFCLLTLSQTKPGSCKCSQPNSASKLQYDPPISTFYDDPSLGYSIEKPIENWDQKRQAWLKMHPSFKPKSHEVRVFIVTGSQSAPCDGPTGDHYLLRTYRNKVDYCRIHGYDIFYNNVLLDSKMTGGWGKLPAIRAALHGPTDQTALAYLLWKEHYSWLGKKMLIETRYYLEGYWIVIIDTLMNITERYLEIEKMEGMLRRRHAEKVSERYGVLREPLLKDSGNERGSWRRPFVTHFAGCQPCIGKRTRNPSFTLEGCRNAMNKALNFADNQVLRNHGFVHPSLLDSSVVSSISFDYLL